jgi:hypothetical protein
MADIALDPRGDRITGWISRAGRTLLMAPWGLSSPRQRAHRRVCASGRDSSCRRFLIHVLPDGFHRIRHYGLFASGARSDNIARVRELLAMPPRPRQGDQQCPAAARLGLTAPKI